MLPIFKSLKPARLSNAQRLKILVARMALATAVLACLKALLELLLVCFG